jgi:hypothetical protein
MVTKEDAARALGILTEYVLGEKDSIGGEGGSIFCDPPGFAEFIYVDDKSGRYYIYLKDKPEGENREYSALKGIQCRVTGVKLFEKDSEEGNSTKVHVNLLSLSDNKPYVLEKAANTNFGRGLLLSLEKAGKALQQPVIIEVSVPEQRTKKTCFCNLHTAEGKVAVDDEQKAAYRKDDADYLESLVNKINEALK